MHSILNRQVRIFLLEIYTLRFAIMKICAFWIVCDCFDQIREQKELFMSKAFRFKIRNAARFFLTLLCYLMVNAAIFSKNICEIYSWHAVPTVLNLFEKKKKCCFSFYQTMTIFYNIKKVFECIYACMRVCVCVVSCRRWQSPLTDLKYSQLLLRASQCLHQPLVKCVIRYFQKLPVGVNT